MEKFNPQLPLRYGIIAFAAVLTIGLMMYVFYQSVLSNFMFSIAVGILSLGVILFLGIWSGITYRRENGGVVSFGHAFMSVYIVFVLSAFGNITAQLLINKVIDTQYAEKASSLLKEKMTDRFEKMNMDDDKIKEATRNMGPEDFNPPLGKLFRSFAIGLAVWAVVALIIAAFIKRGSGDLIASGMQPEPIRTI